MGNPEISLVLYITDVIYVREGEIMSCPVCEGKLIWNIANEIYVCKDCFRQYKNRFANRRRKEYYRKGRAARLHNMGEKKGNN